MCGCCPSVVFTRLFYSFCDLHIECRMGLGIRVLSTEYSSLDAQRTMRNATTRNA